LGFTAASKAVAMDEYHSTVLKEVWSKKRKK
jgi:hypothetical protein